MSVEDVIRVAQLKLRAARLERVTARGRGGHGRYRRRDRIHEARPRGDPGPAAAAPGPLGAGPGRVARLEPLVVAAQDPHHAAVGLPAVTHAGRAQTLAAAVAAPCRGGGVGRALARPRRPHAGGGPGRGTRGGGDGGAGARLCRHLQARACQLEPDHGRGGGADAGWPLAAGSVRRCRAAGTHRRDEGPGRRGARPIPSPPSAAPARPASWPPSKRCACRQGRAGATRQTRIGEPSRSGISFRKSTRSPWSSRARRPDLADSGAGLAFAPSAHSAT